uniref:NADH-ubiquinone oxidoreductase chain 4L n=2 Tax=Cucujus TaxID=186066 RepID=A0A343C2L3_9CUCU|nr:NADH dehydrogenase subunit 4L [Cucujus clavipes]ACZ58538.1 NADH dehydrogenase subunit 4L [Cucujus clavipes]ARH54256.1 NADH dehydrogenase subunit 4L [Cucujus haematodes]
MLILFMMMFMFGLIVFSSKRKHMLLMLLSLEFVVLSLYLNMYYFVSLMNYEYFFCMIFLTMSVCEGALGLSVLVSIIRSYGNDYVMSFTSLW